MKNTSIYRGLAILVLRVVMIFVLIGAGWLIYKRLPAATSQISSGSNTTTLQIMLGQTPELNASTRDITVELYPVDIVAVRHEYFTEPRAGKRFEDFLQERMKGRSPVSGKLDKEGRGSVVVTPGNWWLHAKLSGDEELEWRLPLSVAGAMQTIELTPQNAYTRSRAF